VWFDYNGSMVLEIRLTAGWSDRVYEGFMNAGMMRESRGFEFGEQIIQIKLAIDIALCTRENW
jgi:hypothetical protein